MDPEESAVRVQDHFGRTVMSRADVSVVVLVVVWIIMLAAWQWARKGGK